ncbi:hypothetical protein TGP89_250790 [Toxoplasma gondii p89]|uniref:Phosphatidate phosphatase APP1 catalytic domain-containing protein n=2 Tax=Toxoplasma gondii TaxID=5811 RepID=A0A086JAK4_TOXGO|nr:hypothetical protein TGP89_250790 [Toxoplasma gondii p89]
MEGAEDRREDLGAWVDLSQPGATTLFPPSRAADQDEASSPSPFSSLAGARSVPSSSLSPFSPGAFSNEGDAEEAKKGEAQRQQGQGGFPSGHSEGAQKAQLAEDVWGVAEGEKLRVRTSNCQRSSSKAAGAFEDGPRFPGCQTETEGFSAPQFQPGAKPSPETSHGPNRPHMPRMRSEEIGKVSHLSSASRGSGNTGKSVENQRLPSFASQVSLPGCTAGQAAVTSRAPPSLQVASRSLSVPDTFPSSSPSLSFSSTSSFSSSFSPATFSSSDLFSNSLPSSSSPGISKSMTLPAPDTRSRQALPGLAHASSDPKCFDFDFTYTRSGFHRRVLASPHPPISSRLQHPGSTANRSSPAAPGYVSLSSYPQSVRSSLSRDPASLARCSTQSCPQPPGPSDPHRQLSYAAFFDQATPKKPEPNKRSDSSRHPDSCRVYDSNKHYDPNKQSDSSKRSDSGKLHDSLKAMGSERNQAGFLPGDVASSSSAPVGAVGSQRLSRHREGDEAIDDRESFRSNESVAKQRTLKRVTSASSDGADEEVKQPAQYGDLQVLVDIDDTIRSSGGVTFLSVSLGGIDTQYERGTFYPGCFQFLFELSCHGLRPSQRPLSLGVLTARIPQVPITADSVLNQKLRETALRRGIRGWGIDCKNKVLYSTLNEWIFPSEKGKRKFENLLLLHSKLSTTHPNIKYVWIGDTGEMDRHAGEMMARQMPHTLKAVFLHYVGDYGRNSKMPQDYFVNGVPTVFFRTYIRAARRAVDLGLLDKKGLARTMVQAVADLDAMQNTPSVSTKWRDIIFDIRNAEALVPLKGATLPPLVRTREIVHRRITEIKGALEKFRAKKGASSGKAQAAIGDRKPAELPKSASFSSSAALACSSLKSCGSSSSSASLLEARHRGEERVPESLITRAALHQREEERRESSKRGETKPGEEGFEVLAPAATQRTSEAGTGLAAEALRRRQEERSLSSSELSHSSSVPSAASVSLPAASVSPQEASWVEVRFDPATGRFPVREAAERQRGGSWRTGKDRDSFSSEPFYKTLLHASQASGDAGSDGDSRGVSEDLGSAAQGREREAEDPWWSETLETKAGGETVKTAAEKSARDSSHADDIELLDLAPQGEESTRQADEGPEKGNSHSDEKRHKEEGNGHGEEDEKRHNKGESGRATEEGKTSDSREAPDAAAALLSGVCTPVEREAALPTGTAPSLFSFEDSEGLKLDQRERSREQTPDARQKPNKGREKETFLEEWKAPPKRERSHEQTKTEPADLLS